MPYYEVSGKWYHREYSEGFRQVIAARNPRAAVVKFGLEHCWDDEDDIWWEYKPVRLRLGQLEPEPTFWIDGDQMFKVRYISQVRPEIVECPECHGRGQINGFVPADDAPGRG